MEKMKGVFRGKRLQARLMRLLGIKKPNITFINHPERYWKHYFVYQEYDKAIDYLSKERGITKMAMLNELVEIGLNHYISAKIQEANQQAISDREAGRVLKVNHFVRMLRRWAKDEGYDINKFFY